MAAKTAAAVAATPVGLLFAAAAPGRLGPLIALLAPPAGFLAPDLWLARLAAARARRVRRDLPTLLDLLRVTVEAGSSLGEALRSVGPRAGPKMQLVVALLLVPSVLLLVAAALAAALLESGGEVVPV
jgi:tight adherence protein C